MMNENLAYLFAFSSVLTFSVAAIGLTYFAQKVSPLWMNIFKCVISLLVCLPIVIYLERPFGVSFHKAWPFYLSGFIGLNLGDWLLLSAYKRMGPGRTLVLFGFQPFLVGTFSYFAWGEKIYAIQLVAIIFFVMCLFLFSYEKFKRSGEWEIKGLLLAFSGVFLDSVGVLITRYCFKENPDFTGFDAQYLRTLGALVSFVIYVPFIKIGLFSNFQRLSPKEKGIACIASFFGAFLSLIFYMQAIKIGKLATVTSIVLTDPVVSTFFECLWLRVWPTRYLWLALFSFALAMFFLFYPQWFYT
jgi:drug/metabolite transporter (DMT)-like permease